LHDDNGRENFEERRIQRSSILLDVDKAISAIEQAVHLTPDDHASKPGHLGNLGTSFKAPLRTLWRPHRYRQGNLCSGNGPFTLLPMDMLPRPSHLSNLGIFFKHRFAHSGQLVDIDNTINAQEQAVRLTPDDYHQAWLSAQSWQLII